MNVKTNNIFKKDQVEYLPDAIRAKLYGNCLEDDISILRYLLCDILADLPLDKINKYLNTNFEEVLWKRNYII